MPINILIADDHQMFIDGIKALLANEKTISFVAEANNGKDILELLLTNKIDVVLTDIQMPIMNGIEATKTLKQKFPSVKVIALTMFNERAYVSKMLKAGADGYILKNADKKELIKAIQLVSQNENYFSPEVTISIIEKSKEKKETTMFFSINKNDLSDREKEILKYITLEFTNVEIAKKLFLSPLTINTHRKNLIRKLGVKNTAGLVRFTIENDLL